MVSRAALYISAKGLIEKYGDEAETIAMRRMQEFMEKDDVKGASVWFIEKVAGGDYVLAVLLVVLGVLNYGWVFFPALGEYATAINGTIIVGIIIVAMAYRLWKHLFGGLSILFLLVTISQPVLAEAPILPDPKLSPGAVRTTDTEVICKSGYSRSVRHTSGRLKAKIYAEYQIDRNGGHYEIDHLIPLGIGGADVAANLWPQSYDSEPWNAAVKDRLELKLRRLVCDGDLGVEEAQDAIARNWIEAYKRFCPTRADCPAYERGARNGRR